METYIYLHGFASSPESMKATALRDRFQRLNSTLITPDLNQGDFTHLTLTRQIRYIQAQLPATNVTLLGSSLGGLIAAWVGEQQPQVQRLVLLAPAFQFLAHWLPRLGAEQMHRWQTEQLLPVYHYGEQRMLPLHYDFVADATQYADDQLQRPIPTLILHGRQDEVIPIQASRDYAIDRPWVRLVELDSDHALGNVVEEMWQEIKAFCLPDT
jgi:uncharacterized protein